MNCNKFESRIQYLMDRREDPACDPELVEHARVCADCSPRWQVWSQVVQALPRRSFGFRDGRAFASLVLEELDVVTQLPDEAVKDRDTARLGAADTRQASWGRRLGIAFALTASLLVFAFSTGPATLKNDQSKQSLAAIASSENEAKLDPLSGNASEDSNRVSSLVTFHWRDLDYQAFANLGGESMSVVDPMVRPIRLAYVLVQYGLLSDSGLSDTEWQDEDRLTLILDYVA
jgi:hypothetical protein